MTLVGLRGRARGMSPRVAVPLAVSATAGAAAMTVVPPVLVVAGLVAAVGTLLILRDPEWGLAAIALFSVLRLPDVAAEFHGAPSLFTPLAALVLLAVAVRARATGERPPGGLRAFVLVGAVVLVALGSLTFASNPGVGVSQVVVLVKDGAVAVLAGMLIRRSSALRLVVWTIVGGGAALATLSIFQFATGSFDSNFGGLGQSAAQQIVGELDDIRMSGPIGDPNFYAQLLVMIVPLAYDRMRDETTRILRLAAGYAAGTCALTVVLTFSRGGLLALAVVVGLLLVRYPPKLRTVVAAGAIVMLAVPLLPTGYLDRLGALGGIGTIQADVDPSIRGRTAELTAAWEMFVDHPLSGVGYGNYVTRYPEYARDAGIDVRSTEREAHNLYLATAAELGLLGLAAMAALGIGAFTALAVGRRHFRAMSDQRADGIGHALTVSLIGYLVTSVFLHMAFARFAWLVVGLALAFPSTAAAEDRARDAATAGGDRWR